jgi:hypothetical protein
MSVLDKAVEHFDSFEVNQIDVPEWDCVVYYTPFTLAEKKKLLKFAKSDDIEFLIRTLILKARDEQGEPMFDVGDRVTLLNKVSDVVITRVVNEISAVPDMDEQLGN